MKNHRTPKRINDSLLKVSKWKLKTECIIRLLCTLLAFAMGVAGIASILIGQPSTNGIILCISAIVLMAMAQGFRQIELAYNGFKARLRR